MASRKQKKRPFSGNHQRSWLWGKHAVTETLTLGRWPVLEVLITEDVHDELADILSAPRLRGIPIEITSRDRLEELSKSTESQGMLARLGPYPYGTMDQLMTLVDKARNDRPPLRPPLIVICDRIQDSFNFGALLRCCDGAAVLAVVVGERAQAAMTPHVLRSSAGAANYVPVIQTTDLLQAAERIKSAGAQLVAADSNAAPSLWQSNLRGFNALVLGSEAHGAAPELLALCDQCITIPMAGQVTSLNVAVAAGILLYEIRRQQS